jgi:serine/threonine-protein kinase
MGRHAEAIAQGQRAAKLDPLDLSGRAVRAEYFLNARDYERAIEELQELVEIEPGYVWAYRLLGWIYDVLGEYEKAIEARRAAGKFTDEEAASLQASFRDRGRNGYWRWRIERYEAERSKGYTSLMALAWAHAQLGDADAAFAVLDEALEMRHGDLTFLKVDPNWDPIRDDPRFAELLRRMNFPES